MTTASTSATIAQTSNATFQAWVQEVYTNLVTNCGLSQLSALLDTGQMAVPCVTAVPVGATTSAGYYVFTFNDTLAKGGVALAALKGLTAGTGYNGGSTGTFTGVAMSGGTGSGALATVVVGAAGAITSITITTAGTGYLVGDLLTLTSANMVSAGAASGGGSSSTGYVAALSSGAPVVIKFEFGSGSAAANPQMWITVSSGWSSNGTLVGAAGTSATTRVAVCQGLAPNSTVTSYVSRYVYNTTYGYLGMAFKIAANAGTPGLSLGGFVIFRSNDTSGAATNSNVILMTNSSTATGVSVNSGVMQCAAYAAGLITGINPTVAAAARLWLAAQTTGNTYPFGLASSLINGVASLLPVYYLAPLLSITAYAAVALVNEAPYGTSVPSAIIGATPLTFLSVGNPFGAADLSGINSATNLSFMLLWL